MASERGSENEDNICQSSLRKRHDPEEKWETETYIRINYPELFQDNIGEPAQNLNSRTNSLLVGDNCNNPDYKTGLVWFNYNYNYNQNSPPFFLVKPCNIYHRTHLLPHINLAVITSHLCDSIYLFTLLSFTIFTFQ